MSDTDLRRMRLAPNVLKFIPSRSVGDLSLQLEDFYARVARKLDVEVSYLHSVARGECRSEEVELAFENELKKILQRVNIPQ